MALNQNADALGTLAGLPLVLHNEAAVWWQGVKTFITSWKHFEAALRNYFSPRKPEYLIFLEACRVKQQPEVTTDDFVAKK